MTIQARSKEDLSMDKQVKQVMVVDDSHFGLLKIVEMLEQSEEFNVAAKAKNGLEAIAILKQQNIDVILLDLFMPKCDGLGFLKQASFDNLLDQTKVIVLSDIQDDNVLEQAMKWGAHFVLFKPFTMQTLIERLRILTTQKNAEKTDQASINSHIIKYLKDSGLPSHTFGYQYFRLAIEHILKESLGVFSITKTIYPFVAKSYQTSSANVDKAMRHSVTLAFEQNKERLNQFLISAKYKNPTKKPSNSEYISMVLEKIKEDMHRSHS